MIHVETIGEVRKFRLARTLFGRSLYYTACYWIDGLVVDTGCAHTVDELVSELDGLSVERIVNTHSHEDHIGANAAIASKFNAVVSAHALALPVIEDPEGRQPLQAYRKVMWGCPDPSKGTELGDQVRTNHCTFEVVHTPGHSPDHVCLYEPEKGWIFTGDAYIGGRDRALRRDYDIWEIIESLKRIVKLDITCLFPGSGSVRRNPRDELAGKIGYLEETGERVLELYDRGIGPRHIYRRLFGREMPLSYFTLGHFSGKNLVLSYIENRK